MQFRNIRFWLTAVLGAALSLPAFAADSEDDGYEGVVEEIVVTSRRRAESVQDVPLSVTAFGAEQLDQLKPQTLRDLDGLAPNLYVGMNTAGPGASALYVRGIGYADIEKTQSPQVGVIVDGVQIGSSTGNLIDAFDIESIEVNRGPQGIYFGRNTIGGNIVVNRTKPDLQNYTARIQAEAGNFSASNIRGRVSVPIIQDQLAVKVSATQRNREGYYRNATIGGDQGDVDYAQQTIALRYSPNEAFDATLTYDRIRDNSEIPPQDPRFDGDQPFVNRADKREPVDYDVDQLALRFSYDFNDSITIHNISAFHDSHDQVNQDFDGGDVGGGAIPFAQLHTLRDQSFEVFTQEVRLEWAPNEDIDVMIGGYFLDSKLEFRQDTNNILQLPPVAIAAPLAGLPCAAIAGITGIGLRANPNAAIGDALCQFPNARSTQLAVEEVQSYALFGSATWRATDNIEFSGGLRYINDDKTLSNSYFDFSDNTFDAAGSAEHNFAGRQRNVGTRYTAEDDWNDVIIAASGTYGFRDNNSRAYISYSEGFRSGGFSIRAARSGAEAGFDPEDAYQVEFGVKNEFFDGKLQSNIAFFIIDREGGQFSSIITLPPGSIPGTTTLINNGGTQEVRGWEMENRWLITDNFSLTVNGGVLDVDNSEFSIACENLDGCATGVPGVTDPLGTLRQIGGNNDSRQPDWNYNIIGAYTAKLGKGQFSANVGYKRVSDFLLVNTGGGANQRLTENGYGQLDARVSYEMPMGDGVLGLSVFGKNLTDEEFREQALFLGGPNTGFQGWAQPQIWAFELVYDFSRSM